MISKILVTGGGGFIGSNLVRKLIASYPHSRIIVLLKPGESDVNLPESRNLEIVVGDINTKWVLNRVLDGVELVYHLAAVTRDNEGSYMKVNHIGTKTLLSCMKNKNVKRMVFFSTIAVFGLPAFVGDKVNINESTPREVIGDYAKSKQLAENEVIKAHESWGLDYVIVRPTTVYGPNDRAGVYQLYKAIQSRYFVRIGNGKNKVDYVYVDDVVDGAILAAKTKKKSGDYILGSPDAITFNSLVDAVAKVARVRVSKFYIPKFMALVIADIIGKFSKLTGLNLPISKDRIKVMTANYTFNIDRARVDLGYNPKIDIIKGIKKTYGKN